jgi:hypothetical protein
MNQYHFFRKIVRLILVVLKEFDSFDEQAVNEILEGKSTIKISLQPKISKQINNQFKNSTDKEESQTDENQEITNSVDVNLFENQNEKLSDEKLSELLRKTSTREEGFKILDDFCNTREALQNLASYIDISNNKKDTKLILRERIVERTIGFRLRSQAIQGKPIEKIEKVDTKPTQENHPDIINEQIQGELTPLLPKKLDTQPSPETEKVAPETTEQIHPDTIDGQSHDREHPSF